MSDKEFKIWLTIIVVSFVVMLAFGAVHNYKKQKVEDGTDHMTVQEEIAKNTLEDKIRKMDPVIHIEVTQNNHIVSSNEVAVELEYDELEYLAACVEAEAGTEGLIGKRLVVDVILNRIDSDNFPDTITDVINAPGQFEVVRNGSINKVDISQETFEAIEMELEHRTDDTIMYFRSGKYGTGTPAYKVNNHYFSY